MKLRLSLSLFVSISSLKKGTPSGPEAPAVTEGVCAGGFLFVLEGVDDSRSVVSVNESAMMRLVALR